MGSRKTPNNLSNTMGINIGLSAQQRQAVCSVLNGLLADEDLLKTKTRNDHWNVRDMHFYELYKFFENRYKILNQKIDGLVERVRSLDGIAAGTMNEFLSLSRLKEDIIRITDAKSMIMNLLEYHESMVRQLKIDFKKVNNNFGDAGTAYFISGLMEKQEKMAWMLRSTLE